jgi:secondary thiamine-phosphate synthase enzyme
LFEILDMIEQTEIVLPEFRRGFHLITRVVEQKLPPLPDKGLLHLLLKHTSAGLTLNENADPTVRADFEKVFNRMVPENQSFYAHTLEGDDDLPAHIKSSLVGTTLTIPITNGRLNLGTWQGIYLCEFRNYGGNRIIVATVWA